MATNDAVREADERVERAKASLLARLDLLKQRLVDAKEKVDLRAQITAHPLSAVGVAFALGMLAGRRRTPTITPASAAQRTLVGTALAGVAAVGLRLLREVAIGQLADVARQWWIEHGGSAEERASRERAVEPFLEH